MPYSQADIDALRAAIKIGALEVRFTDRSVKYRDLSEMYRILHDMEAEVNPPSTVVASQVRIAPTKGF